MIEREIKFRLPEGVGADRVRQAVESAGFRLTPGLSLAHEDRYLDTDDWALYRAGIALRLRAGARGVRLEAKTIRSTSDKALVRTEWSQEAPEGEPPWAMLATGHVAALLQPLHGLHVLERLRVRARLRNDRECFGWLRGDTPLGSLTVDHVNAMNGSDTAPVAFDEVEIELLEEEPALERLRESPEERAARPNPDAALDEARRAVESALGVEANVASKLATALAAAGERAPERDERAYAIHPADRLTDVAHKTFAKQFERMIWNEPGTRLGIDPEYLHDMRVATRRLRTAMDLFETAIPDHPRRAFADDLRWVGRGLGRVRDRDVALQHVAELAADAPDLEIPAWRIFRHSLELERSRMRVRLIERLDSERYAALVERARAWIAAPAPAGEEVPAGGSPAYTVAPRLIAERMGALAAAYDEAERLVDQPSLHAFRIAAKRARYAHEYFGDTGGPRSSRRAKRLAGLQDFLGEHQDAVMLLRRLRKYAKSVPARDRELTLSVGSAMGHLERAARMRRGDLRRAWSEAREE
ncbi:MAG TPA: CHAD domain-containing protein [Candidatus Eisenbacteria bacterium]|nr:CHAD domain-containing protein [Candidatus Eisenbacteria bacterium]